MATASRHPQKRHWCIHQRRRERWAMKRCAARCVAASAAHVTQAAEDAPPPVQFPAAIPVHARGRLFQPDVVVVDHAPGGEDDGEGVDDQRRIEVLQSSASPPRSQRPAARSTAWPMRRRAAGRRCAGDRQAARCRGPAVAARRPGGWPTTSSQSDAGEQQEARPDGARLAAEECQQQRREEAAESAHGADQSRDGAGLSWESIAAPA